MGERADEAGWALRRTGAILAAWSDEERDLLPAVAAKAEANGYRSIAPLTSDEVYRLESNLGAGVRAGLLVPDEGLLDPWSITLQLATEAVVNGAHLSRATKVTAIETFASHHELTTSRGPIDCRWIVNAAGLGSDTIDRMLGHDAFTVTPRRGQLLVFDKLARSLLTHIVLPVPTPTTKGVLVSPTIYGNVLLGPTAEDMPGGGSTRTSKQGFDFLLSHGRRIMPGLLDYEVTAAYAGLRAATEHSDYCYEAVPTQRYVRVGGIRSTGISSALALAEQVVKDLAAADVRMQPSTTFRTWRVPPLAEDSERPYLNAEKITLNPDYGEVVCHCERATLGEVRDAFASPIPPVDVDGLRRRTRTLMGRCQGFFCGARVDALLAEQVTRG